MADQLAPGPDAHESGRYNGYRPLIRGRTSQAVSKPCMILNKAWWGDQMVAHKASFFSGLYKAHSVRPYSTHPDLLDFETAHRREPFGT